jgi:hypothetical protein
MLIVLPLVVYGARDIQKELVLPCLVLLSVSDLFLHSPIGNSINSIILLQQVTVNL